MPSKRSTAVIGIWVIFAVMMIADYLLGGGLLDSFFPGLVSILNIVIIAWIPIIFASLLLDRRSQPSGPQSPPRRLPRGARSASGEPMTRRRPQPRIKRDKRAAELETIVVEPGVSGNSPGPVTSASSSISSIQEDSPSSSRFLRARRMRTEESTETEEQVKEQLAAIEEEMAKLEEQLEQDGLSTSSSNSVSPPTSEISQSNSNSVASPVTSNTTEVSSEEMSSERQAIDELLNRLDQRMRAGGVDEATYQRLREKYLKRRSELS